MQVHNGRVAKEGKEDIRGGKKDKKREEPRKELDRFHKKLPGRQTKLYCPIPRQLGAILPVSSQLVKIILKKKILADKPQSVALTQQKPLRDVRLCSALLLIAGRHDGQQKQRDDELQ